MNHEELFAEDVTDIEFVNMEYGTDYEYGCFENEYDFTCKIKGKSVELCMYDRMAEYGSNSPRIDLYVNDKKIQNVYSMSREELARLKCELQAEIECAGEKKDIHENDIKDEAVQELFKMEEYQRSLYRESDLPFDIEDETVEKDCD